ncbi:MAG TPA: SCO family protein [Verrucomicrobiae bacterium]|nr:SCO family protein [Verrucomicrobiae bacterium]
MDEGSRDAAAEGAVAREGGAGHGDRARRFPWGVMAMLAVPVLGTLVLALLWPRATPLPKMYPLPPFALIGGDRSEVTGEGLRGKIWVADFIFTTCPGPCLMMTQRMAELQRRLGPADDVRLVSFTVEPENDTPEVLRTYGEKYGAVPGRWLFLTGERRAIYDLAEKGFKVATVDQGEGASGPEGRFLHSTKMILVDREGFVRGYFDGVDTAAVGKVLAAIRALRDEATGR